MANILSIVVYVILMKQKIVIYSILLLFSFSMSSTLVQASIEYRNVSNNITSTSYPLHLVDGHGRNVTITTEPQRIVSIAPSATEVIYAVGAGDKVVAVDLTSNYPNETESLRNISTYPSLNTEAIILQNPDLLFGADIIDQNDIETLENQGITVFILAPFDINDVLTDIETVGIITNHQAEATSLKSNLQSRIDTVKQKTTTLNYKPKIYLEIMYGPTFTYGNGTYGHDLIELAGGQNIAENASDQYPMIDDEFIIIQNPDIIFYSQGPWTTANVSSISARTGWEAITAVKNGNIFPINEDWVSRGGPRIVDGLEEIQSKVLLIGETEEPGFNITSGFEWILIFGLVPVILLFGRKRRYKD